MKKTFAYILCASFLFSLNSCFKEDDEIFSESAAQRLNALSENVSKVLCSSEDGWVMQYFASEVEQGYPLIAQFESNGAVTLAGKNSVSTGGKYKEESSVYELIQDQSLVLTFDTYNSILHTFSDPGSDGMGHEGDYEFQYMRMSENQDTIIFSGKKYGLSIRFVRFPKGATYKDDADVEHTVDTWESYFDAIAANTKRLFNSLLPDYHLVAGSEEYSVSEMGNGLMVFVPADATEADIDSRTYYRGIIVNLDGSIALSSAFTGENDTFSAKNFAIADDNSCFQCLDDANVKLLPPSVNELLNMQSGAWVINPEKSDDGSFVNIGSSLSALMNAAIDGAATVSRTISYGYAYDSKNKKYGVIGILKKGSNKPTKGYFYTDLTIAASGDASLKYTGETDKNATSYTKSVPGFKEFADALEGDYTVTIPNPVVPTSVKFVSKNYPQKLFLMTLSSL